MSTSPQEPEVDDETAGRLEEPVADEGPGVVSGDAPTRSAHLDGDVPDDAFGEALEAWWEAEEPVEGPDRPQAGAPSGEPPQSARP